MKLFRFEKWFFDIVTPDKDYMIFYHTVTKFLLFKVIYLEIDVAADENSGFIEKSYSRNVKLGFKSRKNHDVLTKSGSIAFHETGCSYEIVHDRLSIRLKIESADIPGMKWPVMQIGGGRRGKIEWQALVLKGTFEGEIIAGQNIEIAGFPGYIDYLNSDYNPLKVPVGELFWGRLHDNRMDITYSCAINESTGEAWSMLITRVGGRILTFENLSLDILELRYSEELEMTIPGEYTLSGEENGSQVELRVQHIKPAIVSNFMDSIQSAGRVRKRILKRLSGDPRGIKFHSKAWVTLKQNGKSQSLDGTFLISEYVKFNQ